MAEIKSTMEMVLARADALCAEAEEPQDDSLLHEGMKTAAAYMKGDAIDLKSLITAQGTDVDAYCSGLLEIFLRHLALPRDDSSPQPWEAALNGLTEVTALWKAEAAGQLAEFVKETHSILSRYFDHRKQLKSELEQSFAQQAAQLEQNLAQQTGMRMNISPDKHPKFQEEWQKVTEQMNGQYMRALDQYKDAILQLLSPPS